MKHFLEIILLTFSLEICFDTCETCFEESTDIKDMKCSSCKSDTNFVFNTSNCDYKSHYPNYYINKTDSVMYPCSLLENQNCYECDPYLTTESKCLSCNKGFVFDESTNECKKCKNNQLAIITGNFYQCKRPKENTYCNLYNTQCISYNEQEIICPNVAPFYDEVNKNCHQFECYENSFEKGLCHTDIKKYQERILFINWFKNEPKYIDFPSYNVDHSGYLMIEIGTETIQTPDIMTTLGRSAKRKLFGLDKEGRGFFDPINDEYEKVIELDKKFFRYISTSIVLKLNDSDEYGYFLSYENSYNNLDFINLKTGDVNSDYIYDVLSIEGITIENILTPAVQFLELNEKNQYLVANIFRLRQPNSKYTPCLAYLKFILSHTPKKINIYSLSLAEKLQEKDSFCNCLSDDDCIDEGTRFYVIQTESGKLISTVIFQSYLLGIHVVGLINQITPIGYIFQNAFHKIINIKGEINILAFYSADYPNHNILLLYIFFYNENNKFNYWDSLTMGTPENQGKLLNYCDLILLSETRVIFTTVHFHGKTISIFIFHLFNNFKKIAVINQFELNLYGETLQPKRRYSLLFKYKDVLGLQIDNINYEIGFVLFGYFNSTDPKQILNIKKDGLNYKIDLKNYLNLQSNIFGYEIKHIKIIQVPDIINSGMYLISNNTKNKIQKDDCIDLNTQLSLMFSYNGTIKQGNYSFKFAGVLQEPTFEETVNLAENTYYLINKEQNQELFIADYNNRRNMNITGRVSLVQIKVLNDLRVFCDKKYDNTSMLNEEGKLMTCGDGKFYEVENDNEITQLDLGSKYYFDNQNNYFIKCHKRCKTCSRKFTNTEMNCDECFENFYIRDDNCLEIPECDYNFYYDSELNLRCINRDISCPDTKPYENKDTKECIRNCEINEFKNLCNPTNNMISINDTKKKILDNVEYLDLAQKLLVNKEKYIIEGNNVTFIFSTSEIEKSELNDNYDSSSIILNNELEKQLKNKFSIPEQKPILILKIETLNNHSKIMEVSYELYNPLNFSEKLDLNLISKNYIEIRIPMNLKEYKMDLIKKTKDLGYNIFDLNDSFYNDICSVFTYNNSDISLSERKNLLDLSDEILCMENCNYSNFDINNLRTICICKININNNEKDSVENKGNIKNSENNDLVNLITKNIDFNKASNIKVVKCLSIIFQKRIFTQNYGFYIMFLLNIFNIIILIFSPISKAEIQFKDFCSKVINQMDQIYEKLNRTNDGQKEQNEGQDLIDNTSINNDKIIKNARIINIRNEIKMTKNNMKFTSNTTKNNNNNKKEFFLQNIQTNLGDVLSSNHVRLNKSNLSLIRKQKKVKVSNETEDENKKIEELKNKNNSDFYIYNVIKFIPYENRRNYLSESEIENLSYKKALKIENRNKSDYYFSLLKEKNKIISMFLNEQDYNIQNMKISFFIFNFNLSMTINALFFDDEAIYEINQDNGVYNLSTQISRVLFSALISIVIGFIVEFLAFSHKNIIKLRYFKDTKDALEEKPKLIKNLKVRYVFYFSMTIFLNAVFLYYITAFCAVYSIIQTHMIKDSLMSFLLAMSYSIVFSLISTIIRVYSLKEESKFRHVIYFVSWIISLI